MQWYTSPKSADPPVVLLAEDDAALRCLVREHLVRCGFDVLEAFDGYELVEYFLHGPHLGYPRPDVVVTDVRMPRASGLRAHAVGAAERRAA